MSYAFDAYTAEIEQATAFPPLVTMEGVKAYFEWAGYRGELILHVIETDESFDEVVREFFVDFSELTFSDERPDHSCPYVRMMVRSDVFRHVLRYGLPWEEITIGFQARLYREPDVYNFDFWNHFQNRLPPEPPW